jgi:creatinine amidohydrolase/Fe(II)-dependent formamide hydrolase-like protein
MPQASMMMIPRAFHEVTGPGNLGDPRQASVERGQALLDGVLDRLCALVSAFATEAAAFASTVPGTVSGDGDEPVPCRGG